MVSEQEARRNADNQLRLADWMDFGAPTANALNRLGVAIYDFAFTLSHSFGDSRLRWEPTPLVRPCCLLVAARTCKPSPPFQTPESPDPFAPSVPLRKSLLHQSFKRQA